MGPKPTDQVRFVLRTNPDGDHAFISVKKATADFLGWSETLKTEFDIFAEEQGFPEYVRVRIGYRPNKAPGKPLRIGLGSEMRRNEAGKTFIFRMSKRVKITDLADLGLKTKVDWKWMERPCGLREPRDWWTQWLPAIP